MFNNFVNEAVSCYKNNDLVGAILHYTNAITANPNHALIYFNRGTLYYYYNKLDEAILDYTKAIILQPDYDLAYYNRAIAYKKQEKIMEAIADYSQALALKPDHVSAYYNRGNAYQVKGEFNEAILDYIQVLKLKPNHPNAYKQLVKFDKNTIFFAIQKIPIEKQIPLLKECIDSTTQLGKIFWKKMGLKECNLESGTLKQVYNYLQYWSELNDSYKLASLNKYSTLFKKNYKKNKELNDVFESNIFSL